MRHARGVLALACVLGLATVSPGLVWAKPRPGDAAIKQRIIQASIAAYPGNCPCPYSVARNGSRCGGRSAYSRSGGYAPLCYPSDVTEADLREYRQSH